MDLIKEDILGMFTSGLPAGEIAECMCLDLAEVTEVIEGASHGEMQSMVASEAAVGIMVKPVSEMISSDEYSAVVESVLAIAKHSDNDSARLKAAQYVIEEKTGRNAERHLAELARSSRGAGTTNVFINVDDQLAKAREIRKKVLAGHVVEIIEVEEEDV
jgi:hypothetical protein